LGLAKKWERQQSQHAKNLEAGFHLSSQFDQSMFADGVHPGMHKLQLIAGGFDELLWHPAASVKTQGSRFVAWFKRK
jgi:hypothetical protein